MNEANTILFRRRHLPHWTVADRSYFVTVRLKGSLPAGVVEDLRREEEAFFARETDEDAVNEFRRARFEKVEAILDSANQGARFLAEAPVAELVMKAFHWLEEEKGWDVSALTVMPNHVHTLMRNTRGRSDSLNRDLGVLKGYTARQANIWMNRRGAFWMDENFDHWCRDETERLGYIEYIRQNPVKAGLTASADAWRWTKVKK